MKHGIYSYEIPTSIIPPARVASALAFVVGTSPINMGNSKNVNRPVLCNSYAEAVQELGFFKDFSSGYTLNEVIYSQFVLFGVSPVIFVNVLDPAKHKKAITEVEYSLDGKQVELNDTGVIAESIIVKCEDETLTLNEDYSVTFLSNGKVKLVALQGGLIENEQAVKVAYNKLDPSLVTTDDIIGGVDSVTGDNKGFETLNDVFALYGMVPTLLAAPGFSHDVEVSKIISTKSKLINSVFTSFAICDIKDATIQKYSDVSAYKTSKSLSDFNTIYCFPKCKLGDDEYHLSTLMLGVIAMTDRDNQGVPYCSPSNKTLPITSLVNNGKEMLLNLEQANFLNGVGVCTALNFVGGFKAWGNRTGCYPADTDIKNNMITNRRMFSYLINTNVLTYWAKVDFPIKKRTINTIVDSMQSFLDGLSGAGVLIGGRITFEQAENPTTNLMDGIMKFHINFMPPQAAECIEFVYELDPKYLETLFN